MLAAAVLPLLWVVAAAQADKAISETSEKGKKPECVMWSYLENKTMPLQDQGHATCVTNDECTGFSCEGVFKKQPVRFGMKVLNCQEPPGLELFGHAPMYNAYNFSHVFKHGSRYEVPGAMLNAENINMSQTVPGFPQLPGGVPGLNIYFVVSMEPNQDNHTLRIGLEVQACMNTSLMHPAALQHMGANKPEEMCILRKPIFNNTEIPVPHCSETYPAQPLVGEVCNVNEVGGCGAHQVCAEEEEGELMGKCECLSAYIVKSDRTCVDRTVRAEAQPRVDLESAGSSGVVGGVVSVLVVIAIIVLAGALVHRYRLVPRLRARLTNTPYEDIVISDRQSVVTSMSGLA